MGILYGKETEGDYQPSLWHRWFKPKITGNELNGLGEPEVRRPTPLYHRQDYWHPWRIVQDMFYIRMTFSGIFLQVIKSHWLDYKKRAPIAARQASGTPAAWSKRIKDFALATGVDKVGIVEVKPEWVFAGDELPERYAIILASRMNYAPMATARTLKFRRAGKEVMDTYWYGHQRARELVDWLHGQGWAARGYGNPMGTPLNLVPAAIEAGIGELGKHGSLICKEMGSLFRLAYVVTDIPLAVDTPTDIGVDDFCLRCKACSSACPPNALSEEKQTVRGVERWYVNFDKCVPYFNEHCGCALCLAVCPWSQPGVGPSLSEKMLKLR